MGVQRRHVPHFKGLIYAKVDLEAQGRDSTFTFCHAQLKKAILHLEKGKGAKTFSSLCILCFKIHFTQGVLKRRLQLPLGYIVLHSIRHA